MLLMKPFQVLEVHMIYFGPKKISVCWHKTEAINCKQCLLDDLEVLGGLASSFDKKHNQSWKETKCLLWAKCKAIYWLKLFRFSIQMWRVAHSWLFISAIHIHWNNMDFPPRHLPISYTIYYYKHANLNTFITINNAKLFSKFIGNKESTTLWSDQTCGWYIHELIKRKQPYKLKPSYRTDKDLTTSC